MELSYSSGLVKGKGAAWAQYLAAFLSHFSDTTTCLSCASWRPAAAASRCLDGQQRAWGTTSGGRLSVPCFGWAAGPASCCLPGTMPAAATGGGTSSRTVPVAAAGPPHPSRPLLLQPPPWSQEPPAHRLALSLPACIHLGSRCCADQAPQPGSALGSSTCRGALCVWLGGEGKDGTNHGAAPGQARAMRWQEGGGAGGIAQVFRGAVHQGTPTTTGAILWVLPPSSCMCMHARRPCAATRTHPPTLGISSATAAALSASNSASTSSPAARAGRGRTGQHAGQGRAGSCHAVCHA